MSVRRFFEGCFALVFFIILFLFIHAAYLSKPAAHAPDLVMTFATGTSAGTVATNLQQSGVTVGYLGYRVYAWIDPAARHVVPGSYHVQPGMSYHDLAHLFALGPARREATVRIIEGWTIHDEQTALTTGYGVSPTRLAALVGASLDHAAFDPSLRGDFPFLQSLPTRRSLEGYLFPDTYRVWEDQLPDSLVRKQLAEFALRYGSRTTMSVPAPLKNFDQAMILASIIEKEVPGDEDRRIVAGIFLKRLQAGMALQSDATLQYLTQSGSSQASKTDLSIDSPYNSYKYPGLPPSPICNPGASAIDAVLHPETTPYNYFLTDKQGKILYARTFEEHIENRKKAGY